MTPDSKQNAAPASWSRLTVDDLANVWAETPTTPMQIALVGYFDGTPFDASDNGVALDRVWHEISARLPLVPNLRRKVHGTGPFLGLPIWVDDPDFRVENHVGHVALPDGTDEATFLNWCARHAAMHLPLDRPLWRLELVTGLQSQQVGMLWIMHHALADGLSAVSIASGMLDPEASAPDPGVPWQPQGAPSPTALLGDQIACMARNLGAWARFLARITRKPRGAFRHFSSLAREFKGTAPRTSLPRTVGSDRSLTVTRIPLASLRTVTKAHGATLNDAVLAAVEAGMGELLRRRGDALNGLTLRASVPVALPGGATNQLGAMFVALRMEESPPIERMLRISTLTQAMKAKRQTPLCSDLAIPPVPAPLVRWGIQWLRHHGSEKVNLFVTNVPGPRNVLSLLGASIRSVIPVPPLVAGIPLGVGVLSYNGELVVSVHADGSIEDIHVCAARISETLNQLTVGSTALTRD